MILSRRERVASDSEPGEGLQTMTRSRQLRRNATEAEQRLWKHLRNRQIAGAKFRRQVPVDRYFVDFLCVKSKVIIELDGGQHQQQAVYDEQRRAVLEAYGYLVLRYWNNDVISNVEGVLQEIEDAVKRPEHPSIL